MPSYPTRFCSCRPNCPNRISRGQRFCQEGQQIKDASRLNATLRKLYHSQRWRALRRSQLDAVPACEDCAASGKLEPATDVHHKVKPKTEHAFFSVPLGSLCHRCHSIRTQRGE